MSTLSFIRIATGFALACGLLASAPTSANQGSAAGPGAATPQNSSQTTGNRGGGGRGPGSTNPTPQSGWEWWKDADVRRALGLTPEKAQRIDEIFTVRMQNLKPYRDDLAKEFATLEAMTLARTVDESTYGLQASKVESLRSQIAQTRNVMLYRMYLMLSPEQYRKLQDIFRERSERDRNRGRGSQPR